MHQNIKLWLVLGLFFLEHAGELCIFMLIEREKANPHCYTKTEGLQYRKITKTPVKVNKYNLNKAT